MTDERDDLLNAIGEALDIEPSPAFAARVRAATVETTSRRAAWQWWAYAAGVSVAAVFAVLVLRPGSKPAAPAAPVTMAVNHSPEAPATTAVTPTPTPTPMPTPTTSVARSRAAVVRAPEPANVSAVVTPAAPGPDLTVIVNQGDVLRSVWTAAARTANGSAVIDPRVLASVLASIGDTSPIVVDQIEVSPIVITGTEADAPSAGRGGGVRRVVEEEFTRSSR